MTSIALCMIVRDESAVIERCVGSALELIDSWVICDTGSSDDTPRRIERMLGHLPGQLHHHHWRDFGHNRSELMRVAKGAADYLLLLDADMTVRSLEPLPPLVADAYLVRHEGDLDYSVPRLVRGDRAWRFSRPTHEYLETDGAFTQEPLDALVVDHHADGSSRAVKYERDRDLLEGYLREHPDDERSVFYLAQTYADLGERDRAIDLYRHRAAMGGWEEEAWYAAYRRAALLADTDWEAGAEAYLEAWGRRPTRAEPLYQLAMGHRFRGEHALAYRYASMGRDIPYPRGGLFVHRDVYEWGIEFEFAIAAYWVGEHAAALAANERLLQAEVPLWQAPYVRMNLDHCRDALGLQRLHEDEWAYVEAEIDAPLITGIVADVRFAEIRLAVRPYWPSTNPSIANDGDGFRAIVRTVGYLRTDEGEYTSLQRDPDVFQTLNYVARFDRDLVLREIRPLGEPLEPRRYVSHVRGFEDLRLIDVGGEWMASATSRELNARERCEIALLRLDGDAIVSAVITRGPAEERDEKNWMPFLANGRLHFVYTCGPTVILRANGSGVAEHVVTHAAPDVARGFRGGSQGLEVDDGFLFVVHEVEQIGWVRVYTHRFVRLDASLRLAAMTSSFRFFGEPVEFCAGLARSGDDLVLSFGVNDRRAFLAVVDLPSVRSMLEPVSRASY